MNASFALKRANVARYTLVAWTVFVWGSRVRNVLADGDLGAGQQVLSILPAAVFLAAAALLAGAGWHRPRLVRGFAAGSTLWWVARSALVLVRDHSVAFKVVHVVLAVVSAVLGFWAAHHAQAQAHDRASTS